VYTIRGAITVENNQEDEILNAVKDLIKKIVKVNNLQKEDIISFIFSTTEDLDSIYPGQGGKEVGVSKNLYYVSTGDVC